jgi:DNA-binding NarL/FixJ family response regulator
MIEYVGGRTGARHRPVRVLVTVDTPASVRRISEALQHAGTGPCEVFESHRAFDVQERLARGDVEAVVIEVSLQGQPVSGLVAWLSTVAPDVPVVLVARDVRPEDVSRALADGVEEAVTGAPDGGQLADVVRTAFTRHIFRRRQSPTVARGAEARYRYLARRRGADPARG